MRRTDDLLELDARLELRAQWVFLSDAHYLFPNGAGLHWKSTFAFRPIFFAMINSALRSYIQMLTPRIGMEDTKQDSRGSFGLIDLSRIGLGDCVTTWSILLYLSQECPSVFAKDCMLLVPEEIADVTRHVLRGTSLAVLAGNRAVQTSNPRRRRLVPRAPRSFPEIVSMITRGDVYLNWADSHTLAVTGSFEESHQTALRRLRHKVLEFAQFKTVAWKSEFPHFIGMRLMFPILLATGIPMTKHLMSIKKTFPLLRARAAEFCERLSRTNDFSSGRIGGRIVVFPGAGSFNAIPASACVKLDQAFGGGLLFAVHESDPWISDYRAALPGLISLKSVDDTLKLISDNFAVCVDGFTSHLAQVLTDKCLLIYTREPRERLAHPGSNPHFIEAHPSCAPCSYKLRTVNSRCPIGEKSCVAYEQFHSEIVQQITRITTDNRS